MKQYIEFSKEVAQAKADKTHRSTRINNHFTWYALPTKCANGYGC